MSQPSESSIIYVVDDDPALRRSLLFLLESVGWKVQLFASAAEFLPVANAALACPCCLLLDIRMPVMSGLELQQLLQERGFAIPVLFMTGHADVSMAVQALKSGAYDFIEKPFNDQKVLDAVSAAVRRCAEWLDEARRRDAAQKALATLSPRELEVAQLVALGRPNKLIASALDISEKTVHIHRQHIMEKANISSAAELARLMLRADPDALE
ncbi:MAG TPA: response regulator [Rhodoferax sp.]